MTQDLNVQFYDTAGDQIKDTLLSLNIINVAPLAKDEPAIKEMLGALAEILSAELPELSGNPAVDLERVSRDINLSRLFRNRGIMLFYRLLNEKSGGVPFYQYFINPYTGSPFRNKTEFVDWFSKDAHVSRDILFRNIAAIDRALAVGITLDQAWNYLNKYAHAFRETLKNVLHWDDETGRILEGIDPEIARNLVDRLQPENAEEILNLIEVAKNGNGRFSPELTEAVKPLVVSLLDEVTDHQSAKDALQFVRHDILTKPEIKYRWIRDGGYIEITLKRNVVASTGEQYTADIQTVSLLLDAVEVPEEILSDLLKRLPITNRSTVDM